jgi:hypothetical protein
VEAVVVKGESLDAGDGQFEVVAEVTVALAEPGIVLVELLVAADRSRARGWD